MTPGEHYREAERLLAEVARFAWVPDADPFPEGAHPDALAWQRIYVEAASVHATLANTPDRGLGR